MYICLIYLFLICISYIVIETYSMKKKPVFLDSFMSKEHTKILKGIAILCVFVSHVGNANDVRIVAPLGGIGVAIFLVCSGYGLNESSKKVFDKKAYWVKRIMTVVIPYAFTRLLMIPWTEGVSIKSLLLDITCLQTQYVLGWYLTYLLFWYLIFWVLKILPKSIQKYEIWILFVISVVTFLFAESALQAQQAFSFTTGVLLSKIGDKKREKISSRALFITLVTFVIGCGAFAIKQIVNIEEISYLMWVVKLLYRYMWAVSIIMFSWSVAKRLTLKMFAYIGAISYEIYLIHGYCLGIMLDAKLVVPCIVITAISSFALHCLFNTKKLRGKRNV